PRECFDTRDQFSPSRRVGWGFLDARMRDLRQRLADDLLRRHPAPDVLLHGDVAPANVVVTEAGPQLIDPLGRRGLPAWDLAQLAVTAEGEACGTCCRRYSTGTAPAGADRRDGRVDGADLPRQGPRRASE